jgi:hypothetical protein
MSYAVVPFKRWHLAWLEAGGDAEGGMSVLGEEARAVLEQSDSHTITCDGEVIACAGTLSQWPGRSIAWAYLHKRSAPHMLFVTKAVLAHVAKAKGRVEFTVRCDFEPGHRWAKMLGFQIETPEMPGYGPEGEAHTAYVRFG